MSSTPKVVVPDVLVIIRQGGEGGGAGALGNIVGAAGFGGVIVRRLADTVYV
jgi:hypothetical protein